MKQGKCSQLGRGFPRNLSLFCVGVFSTCRVYRPSVRPFNSTNPNPQQRKLPTRPCSHKELTEHIQNTLHPTPTRKHHISNMHELHILNLSSYSLLLNEQEHDRDTLQKSSTCAIPTKELVTGGYHRVPLPSKQQQETMLNSIVRIMLHYGSKSKSQSQSRLVNDLRYNVCGKEQIIQVQLHQNEGGRNWLQLDANFNKSRLEEVPVGDEWIFLGSCGKACHAESSAILAFVDCEKDDEQSSVVSYQFCSNEEYKSWMEFYSKSIGHLSLDRLCLVQSHDSGTYRMVSPFSRPWASTQNKSLLEQLECGVRVLDIRLGCQGDDWVLVHDTWRTKVSLKAALGQVCKFLRENKDEVIILDFHRFVELHGKFDWDKLSNFVIKKLGHFLIPNYGHIPTIDEVYKTTSRVLVAWNCRDGYRPAYFYRGIRQGWYKNAHNKKELYEAIEDDVQKVSPHGRMWTVGCVLPASAVHSVPRIPEAKKWFTPGNQICKKVNIIQIDFVVSKCKIMFFLVYS